MMLSKNVNNKKCAPKLVFFNEKYWERFQWFLTPKIDFEIEILALLDPCSWHLPFTPIPKMQYFIWICRFLCKIFLILNLLLENLTTPITILWTVVYSSLNWKETHRSLGKPFFFSFVKIKQGAAKVFI